MSKLWCVCSVISNLFGRPGMSIARCCGFLLMLPVAQTVSAGDSILQPTDPAGWNGDFRRLVRPTAQCPGGTMAQLRSRVSVSEPHVPRDLERIHDFRPRSVPAIAPSDKLHAFHFRSESPDGSFWGFDGFVVARGKCIIHVEVTSHDN